MTPSPPSNCSHAPCPPAGSRPPALPNTPQLQRIARHDTARAKRTLLTGTTRTVARGCCDPLWLESRHAVAWATTLWLHVWRAPLVARTVRTYRGLASDLVKQPGPVVLAMLPVVNAVNDRVHAGELSHQVGLSALVFHTLVTSHKRARKPCSHFLVVNRRCFGRILAPTRIRLLVSLVTIVNSLVRAVTELRSRALLLNVALSPPNTPPYSGSVYPDA